MRLLLLEDDRTLGEGLRDYLRSEAHVVDWCTTLAQARQMVDEPYDAWLIDIFKGDQFGVQACYSVGAAGYCTRASPACAHSSTTVRSIVFGHVSLPIPSTRYGCTGPPE